MQAHMGTHVKAVAWLQILLGVLDLLMALAIFGIIAGAGAVGGLVSPVLPVIGGAVGTALGGLLALTGIPNLLAGFGLLGYRSWARILALILAVLNVFKFPWGTLLAVYTVWVLMSERTKALFTAR